MSRLGKKPIEIATGITVEMRDPRIITVKGAKGMLEYTYNREIQVTMDAEKKELLVEKKIITKNTSAYWGTVARTIQNMMIGVSTGFQKQLELNGVGYRMALQGTKLNLALGFSHPVEREVVEGVEAKVEGNILTLSGIDKQRVGQFAAEIRLLKPVEPYKGKGFRYVGENVRRKEGKKAGA